MVAVLNESLDASNHLKSMRRPQLLELKMHKRDRGVSPVRSFFFGVLETRWIGQCQNRFSDMKCNLLLEI